MQRNLANLFLCVGLVLFITISAQAQRRKKEEKGLPLEFGILGGTTNYSGELSGFKIQGDMFKPAGGVIARLNVSPRISLRGHIFYGQIAGADSLRSSLKEKRRNLSFKSDISEFSAQIEFNIIRYDPTVKSGKYKRIIPYVYTGLAVYKFNPKAYYIDPVTGKGDWWELQGLGTEGQGTTQFQSRKKYSLTQISLPMGVGVKMELSKRINVGFETGVRMTFNDYLDDVSKTYVDTSYIRAAYGQLAAVLSDRSGNELINAGAARGNSSNMDWYYFAGISITFKLQTKVDRCPRF